MLPEDKYDHIKGNEFPFVDYLPVPGTMHTLISVSFKTSLQLEEVVGKVFWSCFLVIQMVTELSFNPRLINFLIHTILFY